MKKIAALIICVLTFLPMMAEEISSIEQTPSWVYLYNSKGQKYKSLSSSSVGEVVGYSSTFFVTRTNSWIYIYDADGKRINTLSRSSVGEIIGVAGNTFTSRSGSWIYTWSKEGKKINTRAAH